MYINMMMSSVSHSMRQGLSSGSAQLVARTCSSSSTASPSLGRLSLRVLPFHVGLNPLKVCR